MVGVYLSGTGNTKHCIQKLVHSLDETAQAIPIEKPEAAQELSRHDFIILAYPVQFSNIPVMVRDFIKQHGDLWKDKQVLCVATMALFSGDGAGCSARLLKTATADAAILKLLRKHFPNQSLSELRGKIQARDYVFLSDMEKYDGERRMAKLLREFDKAGIETELFEEHRYTPAPWQSEPMSREFFHNILQRSEERRVGKECRL